MVMGNICVVFARMVATAAKVTPLGLKGYSVALPFAVAINMMPLTCGGTDTYELVGAVIRDMWR